MRVDKGNRDDDRDHTEKQKNSYMYNSFLNKVKKMRFLLSNRTNTNTLIESVKIKSVYQSASLIAQDISFQLRKKTRSFRSIFSRIVKDIPLVMKKWVEGIRICCSSRSEGAEIARTKCGKYGKTSRNVFNQKIDYASAEVSTGYRISGVKVGFHIVKKRDLLFLKRMKFSKYHKGRCIRGCKLDETKLGFGRYGTQSCRVGRLSYRAIEAARQAIIGHFHRAMSGQFRKNGKIGWIIGKGGFGVVYKGFLRNGMNVAVKRSEPGSGSRLVVVVSSLKTAQEFFTKHDIVLANRPQFLFGKYINYNYTTLIQASYGDHWRNLRRIITTEVLSSNRLNSFLEIRRDEIMRLIQKLASVSYHDFSEVELAPMFSELTFNTVMRMMSGKRYYGDDCDVSDVEEARLFREIMKEILSLGGATNISDFLGFLRWFDFDGLEKSLKRISKRADSFLQRLIDEHRFEKRTTNTMLNHLLKQQQSQPEYYTDQIIKGLIM
ncbi:hypothetical protein RYX36_021465, partial [Vicia faba]